MITYDLAVTLPRGRILYHRTARNADGTAVRCRVNGQCKTWKTRPGEFRLPVKHGLRDCFYLDNHNGDEWLTTDPTEQLRPLNPEHVERLAESIAKGEFHIGEAEERAAMESLARRAAGAPSGLPDFITPERAKEILEWPTQESKSLNT